MKGIKLIYKDNVIIFVEHSDLLDGKWEYDKDIIEIYKDFNFY